MRQFVEQMGNKLHELPPLKRYRLIQQEEKLTQNTHPNHLNFPAPSCLPAKKRKESRNLLPIDPISNTATYSLPAKKRVWAIQPFDLNIEYHQPFLDNTEKSQTESEEVNQIPDAKVDSNAREGKNKAEDKEDKVSEREIQDKEGNIRLEELNEENKENVDNGDGDDEDDGILCAICESTDGDPSDPIVFCDGCELMVHATCYGHPFTKGIPDGDWFCAKCLASQSPYRTNTSNHIKPFSCCLCPVTGGALKPTTDKGKWAHLVCALFVPEAFFSDPEGREGIDVTKVPARRWKQKCYICKSKNGCAIDCSEPRCPLAFHVTCALKENLCIEYSEGRNKKVIVAGFCGTHSDLWEKQQRSGKYKIVARDKHEK